VGRRDRCKGMLDTGLSGLQRQVERDVRYRVKWVAEAGVKGC
jgi:hypothetical protein